MSSYIHLKPEQLAPALRRKSQRDRQALGAAALAAAHRLRGALAEAADDLGITDQGAYKLGWNVQKTATGALTFNDAPHAGIVELGARPHPVSEAGIEAIERWAQRKLGLDATEAASAAEGIARKIAAEGQEPRYVVRDRMNLATKFFGEEYRRITRRRRG